MTRYVFARHLFVGADGELAREGGTRITIGITPAGHVELSPVDGLSPATTAALNRALTEAITTAASNPYPAGGSVVLPAADLAIVQDALADATAYRDEYLDQWCGNCGKLPDGQLCADHQADAVAAPEYEALLRRLTADSAS